jgi:hypothetical protein
MGHQPLITNFVYMKNRPILKISVTGCSSSISTINKRVLTWD